MNRPFAAGLAGLSIVAALSGCTTFSDNDAIARVGDEELSESELDGLLGEAGSEDLASAAQIRAAITGWIAERLLFTEPPTEAQLFEAYADGPAATGWLCVLTMLTDGTDSGAEAVRRLTDGEPFVDVSRDLSLDPSSDGAPQCVARAELRPDLDQDLLAALGRLSFEAPVQTSEFLDPSTGETLALVVALRDADDITVDELQRVAGIMPPLDDTLDVYVDPRFGEWQVDSRRVVALG